MTFILQDGRSPLMIASKKGHLDVVKTLIEAGANVNQTYKVLCVMGTRDGEERKEERGEFRCYHKWILSSAYMNCFTCLTFMYRSIHLCTYNHMHEHTCMHTCVHTCTFMCTCMHHWVHDSGLFIPLEYHHHQTYTPLLCGYYIFIFPWHATSFLRSSDWYCM